MRNKYNQYEMVIRPKGRTPADEYLHKGRIYIEGRENSNYTIELRNNTNSRVMAIVSVDGVAVTDGKPASYESGGFLVDANSTVAIPGWLVSNQQAAEFVFSKKSASYSNQTGQEDNAGVIGVAFFEEKIKYRSILTNPQMLAARGSLTKGLVSNSIAASSYEPEESLGTGFGDAVDFNTTKVEFEKATATPTLVLLTYYDSASNLQKMGIKLKDRYSNSIPDAFPASNSGFCQPPPSWVTKNR